MRQEIYIGSVYMLNVLPRYAGEKHCIKNTLDDVRNPDFYRESSNNCTCEELHTQLVEVLEIITDTQAYVYLLSINKYTSINTECLLYVG